MHKIAMLGAGLIGGFYPMSLQNFRGKDEIKDGCDGPVHQENAGLKDFDDQHFLIKEERMPEGKLKVVLKDKQTGRISQIVQ